jgi:serine protease Do
MSAIEELEGAVQAAGQQYGPAVVGIGRGWGVGSGFAFEPGRVLTRMHNVRHDEVGITFADGRREVGRVLATDDDLDLAVIEVDTAEIEPLRWPDEDVDVPAGRFVLAMSNPGGRGVRVTAGFVASATRTFRGPRGRRLTGAIEHTAPLPRGSAGGPLLDAGGRVLGINAVRVDGGLILAARADAGLRARVEALGRGEPHRSVRLGVAVAPPRVARRLRRAVGLPERDGVLIRAVEEGSAADRAGLERGDLLVGADGRELERLDTLYDVLDGAESEGKLELTILRGTEERTVEVSFS